MPPPDPKLPFGQRVRHLRKSRGWSQEEFAHLAGLDRSYMGGVERGERNVSLENICLIASALGVPPAELFADWPTGKERVKPTQATTKGSRHAAEKKPSRPD